MPLATSWSTVGRRTGATATGAPSSPTLCASALYPTPRGRLNLRFEKPVKAFGPQSGFEFVVAGPEPPVQMQGQGDEGRILHVGVNDDAGRVHSAPRE